MSLAPIILVGAGGHARACIDVIELEGRYQVAGLVGLPEETGTKVLGYPILGVDRDLSTLRKQYYNALISVGQIKSSDVRIRLFRELTAAGWTLPAIVSPRAHVSRHAMVGAGSIVMHGAIINAGASVGRNCIINTLALVEHDAIVGDHCHISTSCVLNSGVTVGLGTFVGSNACVRQGVQIAARCVVGMGERVLRHCSDGTWLPPKKDA